MTPQAADLILSGPSKTINRDWLTIEDASNYLGIDIPTLCVLIITQNPFKNVVNATGSWLIHSLDLKAYKEKLIREAEEYKKKQEEQEKEALKAKERAESVRNANNWYKQQGIENCCTISDIANELNLPIDYVLCKIVLDDNRVFIYNDEIYVPGKPEHYSIKELLVSTNEYTWKTAKEILDVDSQTLLGFLLEGKVTGELTIRQKGNGWGHGIHHEWILNKEDVDKLISEKGKN